MLDLSSQTRTVIRPRAVGAAWVSVITHAAIAVLVAVGAREAAVQPTERPVERRQPPAVVWLDRPGSVTGGGNHGDDTPARRAPRAEGRGTGRLTLRPRVPPAVTPTSTPVPPTQQIAIPAVPEAAGLREVPGVVSEIASVSVSTLGPGKSRGSGDGDGDGLDRGTGRNWGGGPPGGGGGAEPQLIRQVRPNYTSSAMQARVEGMVVMDAVVLPDGSVGDVRIVRSLDPTHGLDQEAIKAVKQWRFRPARRAGDPVAMLVSVEMLFELR